VGGILFSRHSVVSWAVISTCIPTSTAHLITTWHSTLTFLPHGQCMPSSFHEVCTKFGVDSSSHFPFTARTHRKRQLQTPLITVQHVTATGGDGNNYSWKCRWNRTLHGGGAKNVASNNMRSQHEFLLVWLVSRFLYVCTVTTVGLNNWRACINITATDWLRASDQPSQTAHSLSPRRPFFKLLQ